MSTDIVTTTSIISTIMDRMIHLVNRTPIGTNTFALCTGTPTIQTCIIDTGITMLEQWSQPDRSKPERVADH